MPSRSAASNSSRHDERHRELLRIGCTWIAKLVPGSEGTAEGANMRRCGALTIEFVGDVFELRPDRRFSFGRGGDLQLDTSQDLPTIVGEFVHANDVWWMHNKSTSTDIHVFDRSSRSAVLIAAGSEAPIPYEHALLRVVVGPSTYELALRCSEVAKEPTASPGSLGNPRLNAEQRQLLTALAEGYLLGTDPLEIPSNADVAARLGWRITKLNRKLDHLCIKFDKIGVAGLRGSPRRLATERRRHLVEHCLDTQVITVADLALLPQRP